MSRSAIGTLVERSSRFVTLVHLRHDHTAETVRDGLVKTVAQLPATLRRSLTWDQGAEMSGHVAFRVATGMDVYFCDPASPWQRGSNENTNGLLRQYLPKGTDLSRHAPDDLQLIAAELNARPRKTLGRDTPAERLRALRQESWLHAHAAMFAFFGGTVPRLVLGCAIAKRGCEHRIRAHYVRMPDLEEAWVAAQDALGGSGKVPGQYAAFTPLVIDEWLLDRPTESMRTMLLELMERRYGETSTVFCTQYSQKC